MKVTRKGAKVFIEMTAVQLDSIRAVFESFTDQVDTKNCAYGDCVRNIIKLETAIAKAKAAK